MKTADNISSLLFCICTKLSLKKKFLHLLDRKKFGYHGQRRDSECTVGRAKTVQLDIQVVGAREEDAEERSRWR